MLRPGVTQEWVGEGKLPKERTRSEVAEDLRCIEATGELDCFSAYIRLREPGKSEDNAEWDFHGVIDPLLSWRESVDHEGAEEVENVEANSKY
ncbi:hypothetical protein BHE74_00044846 [Ensete ventricosum]|nr:hypothetical protein BHE74_00044846 [Ensete ventricosum]